MTNITLMRHDSFFRLFETSSQGCHYGSSEKLTHSLHVASLFPDNVIAEAEEDISYHHDKYYSGSSHKKCDCYYPYNPSIKNAPDSGNRVHQHGSNSVIGVRANEVRARPPTAHSDRPRVRVLINDNYGVPKWGYVEMAKRTETFVDHCQTLNVNCFDVNDVPFVACQLQKKGSSPIVKQLKYMKGVSCVDQLSSVQPVTNAHNVDQNLPVGARLNQFWKTLATLGASSKVIRILKEGSTVPFQN